MSEMLGEQEPVEFVIKYQRELEQMVHLLERMMKESENG